jgi:hypothetical protein
MVTEGERLAVLENVVEDLHEDLYSMKDDLKAMRESLSQVELAVSRYKGFFGGVVFTVSALSTAIGVVCASLWHKLVT